MSATPPRFTPLPPWPCVRIDGQAAGQLVLELAAGRPLILASAPGIAGLAGAGWWAALGKGLQQDGVLLLLDAVDQMGQVLAALRAGVPAIAFAPPAAMPDDGIGRLLGLAAAHGATLYQRPAHAIEPCWIRNRDASLRQWLSQQLDIQGM
ncbi:hypothetical protein GE253_09480 [Niveispirillum sp. SYP-B3756]|uniref:hypothetical protein n=1 Tax=Niveispirillum sp. SYP-B3756 TaxID=2662178 RepID=UPI0012909CED|nr:hypothetical protein [Niveispirillum sp. SYP-B3756]MQP65576.1 hypothetical protein [Niveispirillum sp. SYP-B3756]